MTDRWRLSPRTTVEAVFSRRGPVVPESSLPISLFIPPARLGELQRLATLLRDAWRTMLFAAVSRDRLPDRGVVLPLLEAIAREALLGSTHLRYEHDRVVPTVPLQADTIQYPLERLAIYADRRPTQPPVRAALSNVGEAGALLGRLATTGLTAAELQAEALASSLQLAGLLAKADGPIRTLAPGTVAHLGHATLLANVGGEHVLVDPWLPSASMHDAVVPPTPAELPPLAGIFITHHHWDHVHPDTLLRLPKSVPIYMPAQDPAAPVAPRTEALLAYLGFTHIRSLAPGDRVPLGDGELVAAPFYGEDPTRLRYRGCCYVLRHAGRNALVHVDSSVDVDGRSLASSGDAQRLVSEYGPLHTVFATRRQEKGLAIDHTWEYLLQPSATWLLPTENCCNDAGFLASLARSCEAETLVLYSEGGADWYPDGTDFLRRATPNARGAPFEYLWDTLEMIRDAVPARVVLSRPFDQFTI